MRKGFFLSTPCFCFLFFLGCSDPGKEIKEGPPWTVLKGTLMDQRNGVVEVLDRRAPFTYQDTVLAQDSLENGKFSLRFKKEPLGYLVLKDSSNETTIFLRPGDSLIVERDLKGRVRFEGKGAKANRYLTERGAFRDSLAKAQGNIFELEKEGFLQALRERRKALKGFRNSYFRSKGKGMDSTFKELERLRDRIDLALMRTSYPVIYKHENPLDSVSFSKHYWKFLDSMDLNDPRLLQVPQFLNFAYSLSNKYTFDNKGKQRSMGYRRMLFETIREEFKGKVQDAVLTYFMLEQIRYSDNGIEKKLLEQYRKEVKDRAMRGFVKKKLRVGKKKEEPPS